MATPMFGFSVGDFITGLRLAIDVYRACSGGTAEVEALAVLNELQAYCCVLERVQLYICAQPSTTLYDETQLLLYACRGPIDDFRTLFTKRGDLRRQPARQRWPSRQLHRFKMFPRKAQWAVSDAQKVEKLRLQIAPSLAALTLLLNIETSTFVRQNSVLGLQSVPTIEGEAAQEDKPSGDLGKAPDSYETNLDQDFPRTLTPRPNLTAHRSILAANPLCFGDEWMIMLDYIYLIIVHWLLIMQRFGTAIYEAPTMLLYDNISFTDALGRRASLPYSDFHHWPIFCARIRVTFGDVPGAKKLLRGRTEFYSLSSGRETALVSPVDWSEAVKPRSKIVMAATVSIFTKTWRMADALKPRLGPTTDIASERHPQDPEDYFLKVPLSPCQSSGVLLATSFVELTGGCTQRTVFSNDLEFLHNQTRYSIITGDNITQLGKENPIYPSLHGNLRRYKYIRLRELPCKPSWFPGFQSTAIRPPMYVACAILAKMRSVFLGSDTAGHVFIAQDPARPKLMRLENCHRNIESQLVLRRDRCNWTPTIVEDAHQRQIPHRKRVAGLIIVELNRHRVVEMWCEGCATDHWAWFDAPTDVVLASIERWRRWIESEPYDADGVLKLRWQERLDRELCHLTTKQDPARFCLDQWLECFLDQQ